MIKNILIDLLLISLFLFFVWTFFNDQIEINGINHTFDPPQIETQYEQPIVVFDDQSENVFAKIISFISNVCVVIIETIILFISNLLSILL